MLNVLLIVLASKNVADGNIAIVGHIGHILLYIGHIFWSELCEKYLSFKCLTALFVFDRTTVCINCFKTSLLRSSWYEFCLNCNVMTKQMMSVGFS